MSSGARASNETTAVYAIKLVMLLNALLIAIALSICALGTRGTTVSSERNWRAPRNQPPDFDPFREYIEFFDRTV